MSVMFQHCTGDQFIEPCMASLLAFRCCCCCCCCYL